MRRGSFRDGTVDYAAVGATQAADLMQYPPEGSKPAEASWRIGSGHNRFVTASETLLTWGALTGAGLRVTEARPSADASYAGVSFDDEGQPIAPSRSLVDQRFGPDGTPCVAAGVSARVRGRVSSYRADAEVRVIFAGEEPRRLSFGLGTIGGGVVSGEEGFFLEWRPNDEVWFTVRAFDAPVSAFYRMLPVMVRKRRQALFNGYLRAISPLFVTP